MAGREYLSIIDWLYPMVNIMIVNFSVYFLFYDFVDMRFDDLMGNSYEIARLACFNTSKRSDLPGAHRVV